MYNANEQKSVRKAVSDIEAFKDNANKFFELLQSAQANARTETSIAFIEKFIGRYNQYKERANVTEAQLRWIEKLSKGVERTSNR